MCLMLVSIRAKVELGVHYNNFDSHQANFEITQILQLSMDLLKSAVENLLLFSSIATCSCGEL